LPLGTGAMSRGRKTLPRAAGVQGTGATKPPKKKNIFIYFLGFLLAGKKNRRGGAHELFYAGAKGLLFWRPFRPFLFTKEQLPPNPEGPDPPGVRAGFCRAEGVPGKGWAISGAGKETPSPRGPAEVSGTAGGNVGVVFLGASRPGGSYGRGGFAECGVLGKSLPGPGNGPRRVRFDGHSGKGPRAPQGKKTRRPRGTLRRNCRFLSTASPALSFVPHPFGMVRPGVDSGGFFPGGGPPGPGWDPRNQFKGGGNPFPLVCPLGAPGGAPGWGPDFLAGGGGRPGPIHRGERFTPGVPRGKKKSRSFLGG